MKHFCLLLACIVVASSLPFEYDYGWSDNQYQGYPQMGGFGGYDNYGSQQNPYNAPSYSSYPNVPKTPNNQNTYNFNYPAVPVPTAQPPNGVPKTGVDVATGVLDIVKNSFAMFKGKE